MECFIAKDSNIKKRESVKHNEKEYMMVIGLTRQRKYFVSFHNILSSIYFEFDDKTELALENLCITLGPDKPLQPLNKPTLMLCEHFVMVNYDNILKVYNNATLEHIENLVIPQTIKAIKITESMIILDCNVKEDNKVYYHYALYTLGLKHINTINKQIIFIDNSQYKNNFLIFSDGKMASQLNSKYLLYDVEEKTYLKVLDIQFNLDNCMILSSKTKEVNVVTEKDCFECTFCFYPITETYALVPCGHTSLCTKCYKEHQFSRCLICRRAIEQRIKIYK